MTDLSSKMLFILSLKSYFLKWGHFQLNPSACGGQLLGQIYLFIIGTACLIITYFLWCYYFSKVYSLASLRNLNFSLFSVQKGNRRFCLPKCYVTVDVP